MNFKAVGKFLLIDPVKEELTNSLGMKISSNDDFQIRYRKAKVSRVGDLVNCAKEGDTVYYDKNSGHQVLVNDQLLSVVLERDIVLAFIFKLFRNLNLCVSHDCVERCKHCCAENQ